MNQRVEAKQAMIEQPTPASERISLGRTEISISPLGIGTWQWGSRTLWGYGAEYTEADLNAAFQASLEAGINFFDTAEVYGSGLSETLLGRAIRAAGRPVVVATKYMPFPWRLSPGCLPAALHRSLQRLGLERVDLYQLHWPTPPVPISTWADALAEVVQAGLVRAAGVSNYSREQMLRAQEALGKRGISLASNQVRLNLLDRQAERSGLLAACRENQITLIAYSPLAQGLLTGKYSPRNPPPGMRRFISGNAMDRLEPLLARLRQVGQVRGKTPSQVALNWLIVKGAVPIPGAKNLRQAQENAGALGWRLTEEEVQSLDG